MCEASFHSGSLTPCSHETLGRSCLALRLRPGAVHLSRLYSVGLPGRRECQRVCPPGRATLSPEERQAKLSTLLLNPRRNLRRRGSCRSFWRRSRPTWLACTCLTRPVGAPHHPPYQECRHQAGIWLLLNPLTSLGSFGAASELNPLAPHGLPLVLANLIYALASPLITLTRCLATKKGPKPRKTQMGLFPWPSPRDSWLVCPSVRWPESRAAGGGFLLSRV